MILREHLGFHDPAGEIEAAERHLHRSAELHPLVPLISRDGCERISRQTGVPWAIGTILAAVADTTACGVWAQVRMCFNPSCHASFINKTRNSAGRYWSQPVRRCSGPSPGCRKGPAAALLAVGTKPAEVEVEPATDTVYVTNFGSNTVSSVISRVMGGDRCGPGRQAA